MDFMKSQRDQMFPHITDWSADYMELRNTPVRELDMAHWAFFHPSCYKLVSWAVPLVNAALFGAVSWLLWQRAYILALICVAITATQLYKATLVPAKLREDPTRNFYDVWLRD